MLNFFKSHMHSDTITESITAALTWTTLEHIHMTERGI